MCNPDIHRRLKMRLKGMNTSVAEQVFSWFPGYAQVLNELRPERHNFLVLYYCRRHDMLVEQGRTEHVNPSSTKAFEDHSEEKVLCMHINLREEGGSEDEC